MDPVFTNSFKLFFFVFPVALRHSNVIFLLAVCHVVPAIDGSTSGILAKRFATRHKQFRFSSYLNLLFKVLSVNGHSCVSIDHYEAVGILKAAGNR
jgi:hypothetical protein